MYAFGETKKTNNTIKRPRTQITQQSLQYPDDRGHLETTFEQARLRREPIPTRSHRTRFRRIRPRTVFVVGENEMKCRQTTQRRQTDALLEKWKPACTLI